MSWSIEFIPFVSWPVLWALAGIGVVLFALLLWRARRGAVLRALAYAMLLLAIANPHLKQEDREPLNDVLAVVVDDSQSQTIAGRDPRTETIRKDLETRLKAFPNLDVRWANSTWTPCDSDTLDIDLARQRPRLHHAFHRPRQGPGRCAARPSRRRDHAHRRQCP